MSNKLKLWLYNQGNECSNVTGGWIGSNTVFRYSYEPVGFYVKDPTSLRFGDDSTFDSGVAGFYTKNKIDLSKFSIIGYKLRTTGDAEANKYKFSIGCTETINSSGASSWGSLYMVSQSTPGTFEGRTTFNLSTNSFIGVYIDPDYRNTARGHLDYMYLEGKENVIVIDSQDNTSLVVNFNNFFISTNNIIRNIGVRLSWHRYRCAYNGGSRDGWYGRVVPFARSWRGETYHPFVQHEGSYGYGCSYLCIWRWCRGVWSDYEEYRTAEDHRAIDAGKEKVEEITNTQ